VTVPIVAAIAVAFLPVYRHRQTIAELESLGFDVVPGGVMRNGAWRWAHHVENFLPVYDYLADPTTFWMRPTESVSDADAERIEQLLTRLPALQILIVNNIHPGGGRILRSIAGRRWLADLSLTGPGVTDETLADVVLLPDVTMLDLSHSSITDNGLAKLAKLPNLQWLNLSGTNISGKGLSKLASLPRLWALDLADVPLDDLDLSAVEQYPALRMLNLRGTRVTDAGIARLRQMLPLLAGVHETLAPLVPGASPAVPAPAAPAAPALPSTAASPAAVGFSADPAAGDDAASAK